MTNTAALLEQAAQATSHPGAIAGRGAQADNATRGGRATDVWTRTGEGIARNANEGNPLPAVGLMELVPTARLGAAAIQAAASLPGVGRGLYDYATGLPAKVTALPETAANVIVDGGSQQACNLWEAFKNVFHAGDRPPPEGVIGHFGAAVNVLTNLEQLLCMPLAIIPTPALPAVRVMDLDVGLPHAHMHPPNLTPPNPVPVPLPSTGPVLPIPYVSGAATVLINGMPAARCGDMGAAVFCGGFFPFYEIFLGSSSVWLEGCRAARVGMDVTKHCIFSNPKSIVKGGDNPVGPPIGFTVGSSPNVLIGGFPLPSLTAMALGGIFRAAFRGLGKLAGAIGRTGPFSRMAAMARATRLGQRVTAMADDLGRMRKPNQGNISLLRDYIRASRLVNQMLKDGSIVINHGGDRAFREFVERDLRVIGTSQVGREVLEGIHGSPHAVTIEPVSAANAHIGPSSAPASDALASTPGVGCGSTIQLDPNTRMATPNMPTDRITAHELGHANNAAHGTDAYSQPPPAGQSPAQWSNMEEWNNINNVDNPYGNEWGHTPRTGHNHIPP